jgi:hypothetical protein
VVTQISAGWAEFQSTKNSEELQMEQIGAGLLRPPPVKSFYGLARATGT